jgi:protein-disulfide isomerase
MSKPGPARLTVIVCLLFAAALTHPTAATPAKDTVNDVARVKGIDFGGLSDAQQKTALKILNAHTCNCGCEMAIATCREKDSSCRRSLVFARTVTDALREGKGEADTVRVLKAKADTFVEAKMPDDSGVVYDIDVSNSPSRGPRDAPVIIVEFSDFQCPYCAGLQPTLEQVLKAFPKEVRLVYKQYPLNIHQYARQASLASLAAHAQGKFWPMHDRLFANFSAINEESIKKWAREIGLNMAEFEKSMQSGKHEPAVQKDMVDGASAKVLGTPTLFVNGKRTHDRSFEGFKNLIQQELAARKIAPGPAKQSAAKN